MATKININGEIISRPGVYSLTKSGIINPPLALSYGNICIVDTGIGAGYGGGSGSAGTQNQGVDSVYAFNTIQDFRNFVKGGPLYEIALPLYKPAGTLNGVSTIFLVQGRSSTPATLTLTFSNGAVLTMRTKDEGLNANGQLDVSSVLKKGYACKFIASPINAGKYILEFYVGTARGLDPNETYEPYLFLKSEEISSVADLQTWFAQSGDFNEGFSLVSFTGSGLFTSGDVVTLAGYQPFVGGTEAYTNAAIDSAIAATKDIDCSFYLCTEYGDNATSINNAKIFSFITSNRKYEKFMVVAGGANSAKFSGASLGTSQYTANYYNSDQVIVVHGAPKITSRSVTGFDVKTSLYKASMILGRMCGLEPQTPITLKNLSINGEVHSLTDTQQEFALAQGIMYTYYDYELGSYVVGQGINTLLNNQYLVNEDGTSFSTTVKRITAQLNKEVVYNAKRRFFGKNEGPNRNTVTEQDIRTWLIGFLTTKQATPTDDNLILRFNPDTIAVAVQGDVYRVTYEFVPNFEISKIIFTGVILES